MSVILITGVTGFIGRELCTRLLAAERDLRYVIRNSLSLNNEVVVTDIGPDTQWKEALTDVDTVIHLAARVHIMKDDISDPLAEFRRVNVAGTLNLARQAAAAGVKRFIFLSSVKVNGEETSSGRFFTEQDTPAPQDPYGFSKQEAEEGLHRLTKETGMEVVIIRPPLVYGPGVKGNFLSMVRWISKGIPLPLGAIHNQRSLVALDNLVDLIITCIDHPAAANQTFLVADGEDLSTTDLLRRVGQALGKPARLVPVPVGLLKLGAVLIGKQAIALRLCGNLQVDTSKAREVLGWDPVVSLDEGLKKAVNMTADNCRYKRFYMLRMFDIIFSLIGLTLGAPVFFIIAILGYFDTGSPIFRQERVGRNKMPFILVKFRTMKLDTVSVASHLASSSSITRLGSFLRKTKLDELPQLWNVLKGEMSLVGPRPNLFNQEELITERAELGVYSVRPGVTGLAQVNDIDMSTPQLLAETDALMIKELTVSKYFSYILQTVTGKGSGDRVSQNSGNGNKQ
jgi:nucleoside-diphosphate-sugar epimerase